jgi:hypothetical protein
LKSELRLTKRKFPTATRRLLSARSVGVGAANSAIKPKSKGNALCPRVSARLPKRHTVSRKHATPSPRINALRVIAENFGQFCRLKH